MKATLFDWLSMIVWLSTSVGTWLTYVHIKKIESQKVEEKDHGYGESVDARR